MNPVDTTPKPARTAQRRIDMVVLDIDGTLLRTKRQMSVRVINAVINASNRGVKIVLATARPPRSVREIYSHLKLDTLQANYNGALIHDPVRRRHVFHRPIDGRLVRRIIRAARRVDAGVVVAVEVLDKWYTDRNDGTLNTQTSIDFDPDYIGPLDAILHVPVTKLMLLAPAQDMKPIRRRIEKQFGDRVGIMVSDGHITQIVHPTVDKGRAVAMIAEQYGIAAENTMAIGDAPNDLGMLAWSGLSVAVENAWPAVHAVAKVTVASAENDGVAEAIDRYVLN